MSHPRAGAPSRHHAASHNILDQQVSMLTFHLVPRRQEEALDPQSLIQSRPNTFKVRWGVRELSTRRKALALPFGSFGFSSQRGTNISSWQKMPRGSRQVAAMTTAWLSCLYGLLCSQTPTGLFQASCWKKMKSITSAHFILFSLF